MIPLIVCSIVAIMTWYYTRNHYLMRLRQSAEEHEKLLIKFHTQQPIFIGDILDEEHMSTDFELELPYDIACILWSMRLNPLKWRINGKTIESDKYWIYIQKTPVLAISIRNKLTNTYIHNGLDVLTKNAILAQCRKLYKFLQKVMENNEVFDDHRLIPKIEVRGEQVKSKTFKRKRRTELQREAAKQPQLDNPYIHGEYFNHKLINDR